MAHTKEHISIRIPSDLMAAIKARAQHEERSVSYVISSAMRRVLMVPLSAGERQRAINAEGLEDDLSDPDSQAKVASRTFIDMPDGKPMQYMQVESTNYAGLERQAHHPRCQCSICQAK